MSVSSFGDEDSDDDTVPLHPTPGERETGWVISRRSHFFQSPVIPYSRKLSVEKIFLNLEILWLFAKVFSAKFGMWHPFSGISKQSVKLFLYFYQFAKVFSCEIFPLCGINLKWSWRLFYLTIGSKVKCCNSSCCYTVPCHYAWSAGEREKKIHTYKLIVEAGILSFHQFPGLLVQYVQVLHGDSIPPKCDLSHRLPVA